MRHVTPAIGEEHACLRLERSFWFRQLLMAPRPPAVKIELVWSPTWIIRIRLTSANDSSETTCSVDALSGSFALFQLQDRIAESTTHVEEFKPLIDRDNAERLARDELVKVILRRRSRAGKPLPRETLSTELLRYPYWVYYYQGRRGLLDIKVLDAATGQLVGNKIRLGILDAFWASARRGESGP